METKTHVEGSFTLARLNDAILRVPTFVPNFTAVENFECQQHGKIFLRQLRGYKLWALQSKSILSSNFHSKFSAISFTIIIIFFSTFLLVQHAQRKYVPNNSANILYIKWRCFCGISVRFERENPIGHTAREREPAWRF